MTPFKGIKPCFIALAVLLSATVSIHAQNAVSLRDWPMPSGHVKGLSKPGFKVVPTLSFEHPGGEKHLVLKMDIVMGTPSNPAVPFDYRYTYRGKEYTDKELGTDAFKSIRMKAADFMVLIQGPNMNKKILYESVTGRYDVGAVPRDAGLSAYSCQVQSLENIFYGGTEPLETAIRIYEDPSQKKTAPTNTTSAPTLSTVPATTNTNTDAGTKTVNQPKQEAVTNTPPATNNTTIKTADPQIEKKTTTVTENPVTSSAENKPKPEISNANANEAKAAYLLAEESYGKGDYRAAIDYLQQVKTSLGSTNCKILYLQIIASKELYAKDPAAADKLLPLIEEFEKSPDYANFNEDKSLEITKLKLVIRSGQKAAVEKLKETEAAARAVKDKNFNDHLNAGGPYGITIDELDKVKPTWKVKNWRILSIGGGQLYYDATYFNFETENYPFARNKRPLNNNIITAILVYDNKVVGYTIQVYELDQEKSAYSGLYESNRTTPATTMEIFKKDLGTEYTTKNFFAMGNMAAQYDWRKGDRGIKIMSISFPQGKAGLIKMVKLIYNDPSKFLDTLTK